VELRRSVEILEAALSPNSHVLDLGGGPGRYSVELARRGHRVTLADLSPANLATARQKFAQLGVEASIAGVHEVNAVDLGRYADASFDAVLAFGPFYHLVDGAERQRAALEIHRVVRPGGHVFVAYVPRHSGLVGLIERAANRPDQVDAETFRVAVETGVFRNQSDAGFQEAYYPQPGELEALLSSSGLRVEASISLKSLLDRLGEAATRLPADILREVERAAVATSHEQEVVATCGHVMVVAARP
jgi:ubiquinone/menaquinone biosynthesis C-methylase UbiE